MSEQDAADLFSALRSIGKDVVDADKLIAVAYKRSSFRVKPAFRSTSLAGQTAHPTQRQGSNNNSSNSGLFVSPRLHTSHEGLGAVPDNLIGIGLAHVGPASSLALAPIAAAGRDRERDKDNNSGSESPTRENLGDQGRDKDMERSSLHRASSWSGGRLSVDTTFPDRDSAVLRSASSGRGSFNNRPNSARGSKPDPLRLSSSADYRYSERERESISASDLRLSAEYLSAQNMSKRSKKSLRFVNGEFNFYRADIAVWRRSFRSILTVGIP